VEEFGLGLPGKGEQVSTNAEVLAYLEGRR
jgi:hypothetical protein